MTRSWFWVSLRAVLRISSLFALLLSCAPSGVIAQEDAAPTALERVVRMVSPELRRIDARLSEIAHEMEPLPETRKKPWGSRYGHRSVDLPNATTPDWLQLDFGQQRTINMLAMVPVNLAYRGAEGAGYGFPKRFKLELADNPAMRDAVPLVDRTQADVANPGRYPLVFEVEPTSGRYLRITSTKHDEDEGAHFWALEELMALEGRINVAMNGEGIQVSSRLDLYPQWASVRIIDGQSGLGMPVDVTSPSPTQGYLSAKLRMADAGDPVDEELMKWCAVDLGEPQTIDQVRVLPLESDAYPVVGGRGYPRRFKVQFARDAEFKEVLWETQRGRFSLGYPDGSAINILVPEVEARYVRVLVDRMWSRDDWLIFGLAELQVYGSNRNLALGKRVFVSDQADESVGEGWAPAHLTDGYTSRYRLIEWPEYLRLMHRRGQLEREKAALEERRATKLALGGKLMGGAGVLAVALVLVGWVWLLVWQRRERRRAMRQLRMQISRDLHDDIGSNLGGIALLSEIGSSHCQDEDSRQDFQTIHEAAEDASLSMRDIVWLVQRDEVGLKDMVMRMREAAEMILRRVDFELVVEPAVFRDRKLSLFFRRHVFFAYKEVLNNIRKHASAGRVQIAIHIGERRLKFRVVDDGVGFDPAEELREGHGLGNLRRRARRLEGSVEIISKPGSGSEVLFEADLHR